MLRIAVPNKGSLADASIAILSEAGYKQRSDSRDLILMDNENGVEFYYLRPRDIAIYVGSGELEAGITGRDPRPELADTFKRINNAMRTFSFEVRSVRSKNDADEWVTHFGLVNTEEDNVMKEHGIKNQYEDAHIRFFSTKLLPEFTLNKYLSTDEVNRLMPSGTVKSKIHEFLERLAEDKWLSRSGDKGFWELGPRSFLELRGQLESIMRDSIDETLDAAERTRQYEERKNELPQILYY
jgi:hypothetical protein